MDTNLPILVPLLRLTSLALVVAIGVSCSLTPEEGHDEGQPRTMQGGSPGATTHSGSPEVAVGGQVDAVVVSSFVGRGEDLAMHIRWEEFGSAQIRGEMRVAYALGCGNADPGSSEIDNYRSRFEGTRDRSTVVLDMPARALDGRGGTWVGKLLGNGFGSADSSERTILKIEDPGGDRMLLSEGAEQDYANAVARLAEDCEDPPG